MAAGPENLSPKQAETIHKLQGLWERSRPMVERRLQVLARAAEAAATGTLQAALRAHAETEAHKLAGSLGMFGFARGTELARQIELALETASPEDMRPLVQALSSELLG